MPDYAVSREKHDLGYISFDLNSGEIKINVPVIYYFVYLDFSYVPKNVLIKPYFTIL